MELYLLVISLLIFFSYFDLVNLKQNQKWFFLVIIFILFVLQDGFRWETGTDWLVYKLYFDKDPAIAFLSFEPGYSFLNDIVYSVSQNYSLFLIILAIIIYSLYLKSINDYTKYPLITALCFYCTFIGYMGMNRQHIALAICLFAFRYILSREILKFSFCVIIASLFHITALSFFIAYFLNRRIPRYFYVTAFITAFILNPIINDLFNRILSELPLQSPVVNKLAIYVGNEEEIKEITNPTINIIFGLTKRVIIFLPLYLNLAKLKEKVPNIELMLNIYFISILFYIIFNNSIQVFVGRGNLYFGGLFEIFLLPYLIYLFKKNNSVLRVFLFIIILMVMTVFKSMLFVDTFVPYKGIYINTEYYREMY